MEDLWTLISPDDAWTALFEESPQALLLIQPETRRVVKANAVASTLYGLTSDAMEGIELTELVDPSDSTAEDRLVSVSRGEALSSGRHRRQTGETFHAHVQVTELAGRTGPLVIASITDKSEPDLIDPASGLPDPRLFIDRLEQSIAHAHRNGHGLGVCLLTIDRLGEMLSTLPVSGSMRLLHDLGDRLRANIRESDTVARVGRSEFALIVEGINEPQAIIDVLRKVLDDFAYEFSVGDEQVLLDPRVGISVYPHDGHEADMLVENAAAAARVAADSSGSVYFFGDGS